MATTKKLKFKSKHTPGPWDVTTVDHSSGGGGATPSTLFRVGFRSQKDFTGHVADKCHGDSYANARLIAAAPDLLEALKECLPLFDMVTALDDHGSNALGQAENLIRAAIAKAEDRSN